MFLTSHPGGADGTGAPPPLPTVASTREGNRDAPTPERDQATHPVDNVGSRRSCDNSRRIRSGKLRRSRDDTRGHGGRVRRLLPRPVRRHPAARPERQRHAGRHPGPQDARHPTGARRRPARQVREPGLQLRRPDRRPDLEVLQRRVARRAVEPGRAHRAAPVGRHDPAGQGHRHPAHHRHHAGRDDVRRRVRRCRGPAVRHGPHAARRPRRADVVRRWRARQPGAGAGRLADRPVHRGRPPGAGRPAAPGRYPGRAAVRRREQLRRRHQQVHRRLHGAPQLPRRVRADRPPRRHHQRGRAGAVQAGRPDRHRRCGRRHLRRRWRRRDAVRAGPGRRPGEVRNRRGRQGVGRLPRAERPGDGADPARRAELPVRWGAVRPVRGGPPGQRFGAGGAAGVRPDGFSGNADQ